ncbi:Gfo/Idh/MocA family protein [Larkinella soli]|uniref:Gfo/Idh/MocA family protein n=1 Tax=Larkinella soli TaxID=1770527 RepID=UPI000FFC2515|nr:Gfo/Idh/MocA family oxidoreductase [Larkinella soli]
MKRRTFIQQTAAAGLATQILPFSVFGKNAPNEKVNVAVIGVNSRGSWLSSIFSKLQGAEVAYICDVEDGAIANGLKAVEKAGQKRKPTVIKDIRKLLEQKDLDAVAIAMPDHWHAPAGIMACAAGKHVYVEKPCGHNPQEGEWLTEAARKNNRIVQMGNQRRSWPTLQQAAQEVREGAIGNPYFARCWYYNNRKPIGKGKPIAVPATLDWELWQGPALRRPYHDNVVHYNWHWFWNWGTGEACNNGTHEIDCCRWMLGVDFPTKVNSSGGRYAFQGDDWETPDTQIANFEFGNKLITWEGRSCQPNSIEKSGRGFIIYGDKGALAATQSGPGYQILGLDGKVIKEVKGDEPANTATNAVSAGGERLDAYHLENFLESIRGKAKPNSDIAEGHKSVLLCHLANISQRTGHTLQTDPANGHILNDKEAAKLWRRSYEKGWNPVV